MSRFLILSWKSYIKIFKLFDQPKQTAKKLIVKHLQKVIVLNQLKLYVKSTSARVAEWHNDKVGARSCCARVWRTGGLYPPRRTSSAKVSRNTQLVHDWCKMWVTFNSSLDHGAQCWKHIWSFYIAWSHFENTLTFSYIFEFDAWPVNSKLTNPFIIWHLEFHWNPIVST